MFVTLGLASLGALGAYATGRVLGPLAVDTYLELGEGKRRRKGALVAGELELMLTYTDWKMMDVEGHTVIMTDPEYRYFQSVTPNDWLDPKVIRLFGEILSYQESRAARVAVALSKLSEEEFQAFLDKEEEGPLDGVIAWLEEEFPSVFAE